MIHRTKALKLLDFPILRQAYTWDCGAASLQSVLAYYGIDEREEVLIDELNTSEENGTIASEIRRVARDVYGLECVSKNNMSIDDLKKRIRNGHPVIVLIQAWPDIDESEKRNFDWSTFEEGHFVTVIGATNNKILFEDPSSVTRTFIETPEFLKRWHDEDFVDGKRIVYNRWGLAFFGKKKYSHSLVTRLG